MTIAMILKASDPASCASFLRGLGIAFDASGPKGDGWRGRLSIDIEIVCGDASDTCLTIAAADALDVARRLVEHGGRIDFSQIRSDPPVIVVTGPNGERLKIEERPERR